MASREQCGKTTGGNNGDCQGVKTETVNGTPENNLETGEHLSQEVATEVARSPKDNVDVVGDGSSEEEPASPLGEVSAVMVACSVDASGETVSSVEASHVRSQKAQCNKTEVEQASITGSSHGTCSENREKCGKTELRKKISKTEETGDEKTELGLLTCDNHKTDVEKSELGKSICNKQQTGDYKTEQGKLKYNSEDIGDDKIKSTNNTNHTEETSNEERQLTNVTGATEETDEKSGSVKTKCESDEEPERAHPDNGETNVNDREAETEDKYANNAEIPDTYQRHNEDAMQQLGFASASVNVSKAEAKEGLEGGSVSTINVSVSNCQAQDTLGLEKTDNLRRHEVVLAIQDSKTTPRVEDIVPERLETSASSDINHSGHVFSPTEEKSRKRDGVVILNLLPDDLINVRLSHLSDISEENDTQLDAASASGDTYQVLESDVLQDSECSVSAGDEEQAGKCHDTAGEVTYFTMDVPCPDDDDTNGKGDCPSESCSERISTEAVIENTGTESGSERVDGGEEQVAVEDRDSLAEDLPTDEEQRLLVPKAECDSIDLMEEDDTSIQNEPLPDPKDSRPDPKSSPGVQRVAKAFIQTRYKNMSKKRRFYTTVIKYILFFFNFKCWVSDFLSVQL